MLPDDLQIPVASWRSELRHQKDGNETITGQVVLPVLLNDVM